jgi:hypothetical protein
MQARCAAGHHAVEILARENWTDSFLGAASSLRKIEHYVKNWLW